MKKTKIKVIAGFSSLLIMALGMLGYNHLQTPILKAANTSALTTQIHSKETVRASGSAAGTSPGGTASTPAVTAPTAPKASAKAPTTLPTPGTAVTPADSAPSGQSLYANPSSNIAIGARAWAAANGDSAIMNRLANVPMANWYGDFSGSNVQSAVNNYVSAASNAGAVPQLVAYNIPKRDCGSYSAGGASSASAYQSWISSLAAGIGMRTAIVVVEPDALAGMDCLSSGDQATRLQLLSYAVSVLQSKTRASVYLDAGNAGWQSVATMANRLKGADIAEATGFSLNVSNFQTTAANTSYGSALSAAVGGKHYVIDTSRNGNGPANGTDAWCNPDGRAFGMTPTLQTGRSLVDAYLWVKGAGESDGSCGADQAGSNAPSAGAWWPQYALMLAHNSGW